MRNAALNTLSTMVKKPTQKYKNVEKCEKLTYRLYEPSTKKLTEAKLVTTWCTIIRKAHHPEIGSNLWPQASQKRLRNL